MALLPSAALVALLGIGHPTGTAAAPTPRGRFGRRAISGPSPQTTLERSLQRTNDHAPRLHPEIDMELWHSRLEQTRKRRTQKKQQRRRRDNEVIARLCSDFETCYKESNSQYSPSCDCNEYSTYHEAVCYDATERCTDASGTNCAKTWAGPHYDLFGGYKGSWTTFQFAENDGSKTSLSMWTSPNERAGDACFLNVDNAGCSSCTYQECVDGTLGFVADCSNRGCGSVDTCEKDNGGSTKFDFLLGSFDFHLDCSDPKSTAAPEDPLDGVGFGAADDPPAGIAPAHPADSASPTPSPATGGGAPVTTGLSDDVSPPVAPPSADAPTAEAADGLPTLQLEGYPHILNSKEGFLNWSPEYDAEAGGAFEAYDATDGITSAEECASRCRDGGAPHGAWNSQDGACFCYFVDAASLCREPCLEEEGVEFSTVPFEGLGFCPKSFCDVDWYYTYQHCIAVLGYDEGACDARIQELAGQGLVDAPASMAGPKFGPGPSDLLIVNEAHEQCVNHAGRSPQLFGGEIDNCEVDETDRRPGSVTIKCANCRLDQTAQDPDGLAIGCDPEKAGDAERAYVAACEGDGGVVGRSHMLFVTCKSAEQPSELVHYYNFAHGGADWLDGEAPASIAVNHIYWGMRECYASKECWDVYRIRYPMAKETCQAEDGYEGWYAAYIEGQYRSAGLDSVTCSTTKNYDCPVGYDAPARPTPRPTPYVDGIKINECSDTLELFGDSPAAEAFKFAVGCSCDGDLMKKYTMRCGIDDYCYDYHSSGDKVGEACANLKYTYDFEIDEGSGLLLRDTGFVNRSVCTTFLSGNGPGTGGGTQCKVSNPQCERQLRYEHFLTKRESATVCSNQGECPKFFLNLGYDGDIARSYCPVTSLDGTRCNSGMASICGLVSPGVFPTDWLGTNDGDIYQSTADCSNVAPCAVADCKEVEYFDEEDPRPVVNNPAYPRCIVPAAAEDDGSTHDVYVLTGYANFTTGPNDRIEETCGGICDSDPGSGCVPRGRSFFVEGYCYPVTRLSRGQARGSRTYHTNGGTEMCITRYADQHCQVFYYDEGCTPFAELETCSDDGDQWRITQGQCIKSLEPVDDFVIPMILRHAYPSDEDCAAGATGDASVFHAGHALDDPNLCQASRWAQKDLDLPNLPGGVRSYCDSETGHFSNEFFTDGECTEQDIGRMYRIRVSIGDCGPPPYPELLGIDSLRYEILGCGADEDPEYFCKDFAQIGGLGTRITAPPSAQPTSSPTDPPTQPLTAKPAERADGDVTEASGPDSGVPKVRGCVVSLVTVCIAVVMYSIDVIVM